MGLCGVGDTYIYPDETFQTLVLYIQLTVHLPEPEKKLDQYFYSAYPKYPQVLKYTVFCLVL